MSIDMIAPKCLGPTTPFAFISAFLAISPQHSIFKKVNYA
jgi:hypothetical protein